MSLKPQNLYSLIAFAVVVSLAFTVKKLGSAYNKELKKHQDYYDELDRQLFDV